MRDGDVAPLLQGAEPDGAFCYFCSFQFFIECWFLSDGRFRRAETVCVFCFYFGSDGEAEFVQFDG